MTLGGWGCLYDVAAELGLMFNCLFLYEKWVLVDIPVNLVYVRSLEYKGLRLNSIIKDFNSKNKHF